MKGKEQPEHRINSVPGATRRTVGLSHAAKPQSQPFGEHVRELRQRLMYCVLTLVSGTILGYGIHERIFSVLRKPLHAQLYYANPTGGFNAIIKISIMFGMIVSVPVITYQLGKFLSPAFKHRIKAMPIILVSAFLAVMGVLFAYFLSLPAALHFLANIDTQNFQPLIMVNEYLGFVFAYLVAFALLFQLPLVLLFINRIKPQKPGRLMRYQRWVILISFVLAAILTPTPDPINQTIMALPIILLYQFSVILIWIANRTPKARARAAEALQAEEEDSNYIEPDEPDQDEGRVINPGTAVHGPAVPALTAYSAASYSGETAFPSTLPQASPSSTDTNLINDIYNTSA